MLSLDFPSNISPKYNNGKYSLYDNYSIINVITKTKIEIWYNFLFISAWFNYLLFKVYFGRRFHFFKDKKSLIDLSVIIP